MSLGTVLLILALYVLSVARLTKLINSDLIANPLHIWITDRAATAREAADEAKVVGQETTAALYTRKMWRWNTAAFFVGCAWCVGFWLSLATAVIPVLIIGWPLWTVLPVALSASHLIGVAAGLVEEETEVVKK